MDAGPPKRSRRRPLLIVVVVVAALAASTAVYGAVDTHGQWRAAGRQLDAAAAATAANVDHVNKSLAAHNRQIVRLTDDEGHTTETMVVNKALWDHVQQEIEGTAEP